MSYVILVQCTHAFLGGVVDRQGVQIHGGSGEAEIFEEPSGLWYMSAPQAKEIQEIWLL